MILRALAPFVVQVPRPEPRYSLACDFARRGGRDQQWFTLVSVAMNAPGQPPTVTHVARGMTIDELSENVLKIRGCLLKLAERR
jgi:hypothetical protein